MIDCDEFATILRSIESDDYIPTFKAVDYFLAYIAPHPDAKQKAVNSTTVPAKR